MAKLRISPEFLLAQLFADAEPRPNVEIVGAAFNSITQTIELEIIGADVPDVAEVNAIFTVQRRVVSLKFEAVKPFVPGAALQI